MLPTLLYRYAGGLDAEGNCRGPGANVERVYIAHSHWFPLIGLVDTYIVFRYMGLVGGLASMVSKLLKGALACPASAGCGDGGTGSGGGTSSMISTGSSTGSASSSHIAGLIRPTISSKSSFSMGGVAAVAVINGGGEGCDDIRGDAAADVRDDRHGRRSKGGGKGVTTNAGKLGSSSSRGKSSGEYDLEAAVATNGSAGKLSNAPGAAAAAAASLNGAGSKKKKGGGDQGLYTSAAAAADAAAPVVTAPSSLKGAAGKASSKALPFAAVAAAATTADITAMKTSVAASPREAATAAATPAGVVELQVLS